MSDKIPEIIFGANEGGSTNYESSEIVIVPVPYDGTSTWIKGSDKGPIALLKASANLEFYDIQATSCVCERGIYTDKPITEDRCPQSMALEVKKIVGEHLNKNKFTIVIGGEHSVSIGSIYAHAKRTNNLTVIQFDAHADLRESYDDHKYNHACVMARVKEHCPVVQIGIRSVAAEEKDAIEANRIFYAHEIYNNDDWHDKAIELLTDNVYITVDLDVFDPGVMPSTGTPEPGGMGWYEFMNFVEKVIKKKNLVGFDVVELCPNENHPGPDFFAAKLLYRLCSMKFAE
ncbi:MAG: agmatinase [Phycisphaerae bacterium]|nr:agmatinase [Phycisphaerae bacterium]